MELPKLTPAVRVALLFNVDVVVHGAEELGLLPAKLNVIMVPVALFTGTQVVLMPELQLLPLRVNISKA